jgi:Ca2+-binding RTX toxin-like protein
MPVFNGTSANNTINGSNQADELNGFAGHDTLNGGGGADTLVGGEGNDVYITDGLDTLIELAGEGTDEVRAAVSFTLPEHFENLRLQGSAAINGTGNAANNTLWGNSGANVLNGGGGNDTMRGAAGDDIYITDGGDTLIETAGQGTDEVRSSASYTLLNHFENLVLTGSASINGSGNTANNVITGNAGDNVLNGGAGIDTLQMTATAPYQASVNLTTGVGTGNGNDTLLNFENVRGTEQSDVITGNAGNNHIDGAGGSDEIFATSGIDTIVGGEGNDLIRFDLTGAAVVNLATGSYSLGAAGQGTLSSITHAAGSPSNDVIVGNADRNHLYGGAGDDTMSSGGGDFDVVFGGAGADRLIAEGGIVTMSGDHDFWSTLDDDAADVFEIRPQAGSITIDDFQLGVDKLDLTGFGFDQNGVSLNWTASASYKPLGLELKLVGQGEVTILLQGVTSGQPTKLTMGDMVGGSAALLPPAPTYPPGYGANGVADVWVIDPFHIFQNLQGEFNIVGFEDGLDLVDLRALDLNGTAPYWSGWVYDYGPNDQTRMEFWGLNGEAIAINLMGHSYFNIDSTDVLL